MVPCDFEIVVKSSTEDELSFRWGSGRVFLLVGLCLPYCSAFAPDMAHGPQLRPQLPRRQSWGQKYGWWQSGSALVIQDDLDSCSWGCQLLSLGQWVLVSAQTLPCSFSDLRLLQWNWRGDGCSAPQVPFRCWDSKSLRACTYAC